MTIDETTISRRHVLTAVGALGAFAAVPGLSPAAHGQRAGEQPPAGATDRDFVMAAGMTEAEATCWETIAKAAGQFFNLPELHPMDRQEVASAIHIVQNKLLSRPTYRAYLERAKAAAPPRGEPAQP